MANNKRLKRTANKESGWLHPTKGWRKNRRDPNPGFVYIYSFLSRGFVPNEILKPWNAPE